jgi:hypothetical protein
MMASSLSLSSSRVALRSSLSATVSSSSSSSSSSRDGKVTTTNALRRRPRSTTRRMASASSEGNEATFTTTIGGSSNDNDKGEKETFTVEVQTIVARRAIQWDSLAIGDENRAIYVSGVAFDSEAEQKGIKPGMRLVAITDPVDKSEMWQIPKNVTFVRAMDAIRSTRAYDIQLTFEKEQSITREMVEYAKALQAGDEEEEERRQIEEDEIRRAMMSGASSSSAAASPSASAANNNNNQRIARPSQGEKERPDLYSDKWQGDEYVGDGPWNELTVGLVIAVAVPLLITVIAAATNGVLWNVPDSINRYR